MSTLMQGAMHRVVSEYPHSTFKGTPTYSSHSGAALFKTFNWVDNNNNNNGLL